MDYCSSCLRHTNGALVCPGCGAYAADIATPPAHALRTTAVIPAATSDGYRTEEPSSPAPYPDGDWPADGSRAAGSRADTSGEAEYTARPSQGRAARRRQVARWKKNRRRAAA